jgi:hypothetical protein
VARRGEQALQREVERLRRLSGTVEGSRAPVADPSLNKA